MLLFLAAEAIARLIAVARDEPHDLVAAGIFTAFIDSVRYGFFCKL